MSAGGPSSPPRLLAPRALAAVIDAAIALGVSAVLGIPALVLLVLGGEWTRGADGSRVLAAVPPGALVLLAGAVVLLVGTAGWNHGIRQGRDGQSLGKRRCRLLVVQTHGTGPLGAGRGLIRWLLSIVLALPCLATYLWVVVDPRARTWHDLLVGSSVVRPGLQ